MPARFPFRLGHLLLGSAISGLAVTAVAADAPAASRPAAQSAPAGAPPWKTITAVDFAGLPIDRMPPDDGNVAPIAVEGQEPARDTAQAIQRLVEALPKWKPAQVSDPVQRVRNYLVILGAVDLSQSVLERYLPAAILTHLLKELPAEDLPKVLCWIAQHPEEGDMNALSELAALGIATPKLDPEEVRTRTYYYAVKMTRWVIGW